MAEGEKNVQLPIVVVGIWQITHSLQLQDTCVRVTAQTKNEMYTSCFYVIPGEHFTMLKLVVPLEIPFLTVEEAVQDMSDRYSSKARRPRPACAPSLFLEP